MTDLRKKHELIKRRIKFKNEVLDQLHSQKKVIEEEIFHHKKEVLMLLDKQQALVDEISQNTENYGEDIALST